MQYIETMTTLLIRAKRRLLQMHFESGVGHIGGNLSALDAMLVLLTALCKRVTYSFSLKAMRLAPST